MDVREEGYDEPMQPFAYIIHLYDFFKQLILLIFLDCSGNRAFFRKLEREMRKLLISKTIGCSEADTDELAKLTEGKRVLFKVKQFGCKYN